MGTYKGTNEADTITPDELSAGVTADRLGSRPSDAADIINGLAGNDNLNGGGGGDRINGGDGNDVVSGVNGGNILHGDGGNDTVGVDIYGGSGEGGTDATNSLYGDDGDDHITAENSLSGSDFEGDLPSGMLKLVRRRRRGFSRRERAECLGAGRAASLRSNLHVRRSWR